MDSQTHRFPSTPHVRGESDAQSITPFAAQEAQTLSVTPQRSEPVVSFASLSALPSLSQDANDSCNNSAFMSPGEPEAAQESVKVMVRVRPMLEDPYTLTHTHAPAQTLTQAQAALVEEVKGVAETDESQSCERDVCALVTDSQTLKILGADQSSMSSIISKFDANRTKERTYRFHRVFDERATQEAVFAEVEDLVVAAVEGYNATILAHGPQSGGKTFTITGSFDAPGIIPRAVDTIFSKLRRLTRSKRRSNNLYNVEMCYVEWYNNSFRDLLRDDINNNNNKDAPMSKESKSAKEHDADNDHADTRTMSAYEAATIVRGDKIDVRESPMGVLLVGPNLRRPVAGSEDVINLVVKGDQNRAFSGGAGSTSTRGHAILTIFIETKVVPSKDEKPFSKGELRLGKITFVDLASGERLVNSFDSPKKQSQDDKEELIKINKSLNALNEVIRVLGSNATLNQSKRKRQRQEQDELHSITSPIISPSRSNSSEMHVPYMNSKFTQLLRDSFGGNGKSAVIMNIPCEKCHLQLILNALSFANKAKKVLNNPVQNKIEISADVFIDTRSEQSVIAQLKQQLLEPFMRQAIGAAKGQKRTCLSHSSIRPKSYNFTIKNIVAKDLPYKCFPMRPWLRLELKGVTCRTSKQIYKFNSVQFPEEFTFEIDAADFDNVELDIRIFDKVPFRSRWEGRGRCRVNEHFVVMEEKAKHVERLLFDDNSLDGYTACGQLQFCGIVRSSVLSKASYFELLSPKALPPVSHQKKAKPDLPVPEFNPNRSYVLSVKSFMTTDAHVTISDSALDVVGGYKFCIEARLGEQRKRSGFIGGKGRYRGKDKIATVCFEDPDVKIRTLGSEVKKTPLHIILYVKGSDAANQVIGRIIQPVDLLLNIPGDECVSKEFTNYLKDVTNKVTGKVTFTVSLHSASILKESEEYLDESFHVQNNLGSLKSSPMEFGWIRITSVEGMRMNILRLLGLHARKVRSRHQHDLSIHQDLLLVMEYGEHWVGTSQLMQDRDDCCSWNNIDFKIFSVRDDLLRLPLKISIFNRKVEGKEGLIGSAAVYLHQVLGEHLSINKAEVYIRTRRGKPNGKLVLNGMLVKDNGDSWMAATIVKVRHDGNYDIRYEDGEIEKNVSKDLLLMANNDPRLKHLSPRIVAARPRSKYPVGTKVEVLYGGKDLWYPATVIADHNNAYYDLESDYEIAKVNVHQSTMRLPANQPTNAPNNNSNVASASARKGHANYYNGNNGAPHNYSVGDKVEANFKSKGKWYPATIWKIRTLEDGTNRFDLDYESGVRECGITNEKMRPAFANKYYHTPSLYNKNRETIFDSLVAAATGNIGIGINVNVYNSLAADDRSVDSSEGANYVPNAISPRRLSSTTETFSDSRRRSSSHANNNPSHKLQRTRSHHAQSMSAANNNMNLNLDSTSNSNSAGGDEHTEGSHEHDALLISEDTDENNHSNNEQGTDAEHEGTTDHDTEHEHDNESVHALEHRVFTIGDRVEANYREQGMFLPGVVTEVEENGLTIHYDNGDCDANVALESVRPFGMSMNMSMNTNINNTQNSDGLSSSMLTFNDEELPPLSSSLSVLSADHEEHRFSFKVHEKVEANYRGIGKWLPGRISKNRGGGVFDVAYEDGRIETKVTVDCLRKYDPETQIVYKFNVGDEVEVNSKGLGYWYPCRIAKQCADGRYDTVFEDGEIEAHVPEMFVRVPRRDNHVIPSAKPVYAVGDKVMVKSRSRSVEQEIKNFQDSKKKSEVLLEELFISLRTLEMEEGVFALATKRWEAANSAVKDLKKDLHEFVLTIPADQRTEFYKLKHRAENEEAAAQTSLNESKKHEQRTSTLQKELKEKLARIADLEKKTSKVTTHIASSSRSGLEEAEMHSLISGTQHARTQMEDIESAKSKCAAILQSFEHACGCIDDSVANLNKENKTLHALYDFIIKNADEENAAQIREINRDVANKDNQLVLNSSGHFENMQNPFNEDNLDHDVGYDNIYLSNTGEEISPREISSTKSTRETMSFKPSFDFPLNSGLGTALLGEKMRVHRQYIDANAESERVVFGKNPLCLSVPGKESESKKMKKKVSLSLPEDKSIKKALSSSGSFSSLSSFFHTQREKNKTITCERTLISSSQRGKEYTPCATLSHGKLMPIFVMDFPDKRQRLAERENAAQSTPTQVSAIDSRIAEAYRTVEEKKLRADLAEALFYKLNDFSKERDVCEALQKSINHFISRHYLELVVESRGSDEIDRSRSAAEAERRTLELCEEKRMQALKEAEEARNLSLERFDELLETKRPDYPSHSDKDNRMSCGPEQYLQLLDVTKQALVEEWSRWEEVNLLAQEEKLVYHKLQVLLKRRLKELRMLARKIEEAVEEYIDTNQLRADTADIVNEMKLKVEEKRKEFNNLKDQTEREAMTIERLEKKANECGGLFRTHSFSALRLARTPSFKLTGNNNGPLSAQLNSLSLHAALSDETHDDTRSLSRDDDSVSLCSQGMGIAVDEAPSEMPSARESDARFPSMSLKHRPLPTPATTPVSLPMPAPMQRSLSFRMNSSSNLLAHLDGVSINTNLNGLSNATGVPPSSPSATARTRRMSTPRKLSSDVIKELVADLPKVRASEENLLNALQEKSEELFREVRRSDNFWAKNEKEAFPAALSVEENVCPATVEHLANYYALNCAKSYMLKGNEARKKLEILLQEELESLQKIIELCAREKSIYMQCSAQMVKDNEELSSMRKDIEVEVGHETAKKKLQKERLQLLTLKDQVQQLDKEIKTQEKTLLVHYANSNNGDGSPSKNAQNNGSPSKNNSSNANNGSNSARRFFDPNNAAIAEEQAKRQECMEQAKKFQELSATKEKVIHDEAIQRIGKEFHAIKPGSGRDNTCEIDHAQLQDVMALYDNESHDISDAIRYTKEQVKAFEAAMQHIRREQDLMQFGKLDKARSNFEVVSARWKEMDALLGVEVTTVDCLQDAYHNEEKNVTRAFKESLSLMNHFQKLLQSLPGGQEYLLTNDYKHKRKAFDTVMTKIARLRKKRLRDHQAVVVKIAQERVRQCEKLSESRAEVIETLQAAEEQFRDYNATSDGYSDTVTALTEAKARVAADLQNYQQLFDLLQEERSHLETESKSLEDETQYLDAAKLYLEDIRHRVTTEQARADCSTGLGRILAFEKGFVPNKAVEDPKWKWRERLRELQPLALRPLCRGPKLYISMSARANRFLLTHPSDGVRVSAIEIKLDECNLEELITPAVLSAAKKVLPETQSSSYAPVFMVSRAKVQVQALSSVSASASAEGTSTPGGKPPRSPVSDSAGTTPISLKGRSHTFGSISFHEPSTRAPVELTNTMARSHSFFSMSEGGELDANEFKSVDIEDIIEEPKFTDPYVNQIKALEKEINDVLKAIDDKWLMRKEAPERYSELRFTDDQINAMLQQIRMVSTPKPVSLPDKYEEEFRKEFQTFWQV